jgi:hypothetical protein
MIVDRQIMNIAYLELTVRHSFAGLLQHLRRRVDADDPMAGLSSDRTEPAGTARGIKHSSSCLICQNLADNWHVEREQTILGSVIRGRPPGVAVDRTDMIDVDTVALEFWSVEKTANFGKPGLDKGAIMLAGVRTEQRDALKSE